MDLPPPIRGNDPLRYRFEIALGAPGTPPQNLTVDLCNKLDVSCGGPIDTFVPDGNGAIALDLAPTFKGYLLVHAQVNDPPVDIHPTLVFFEKPVVIPGVQQVIRVIDTKSLENLSKAQGVTLDPERGISIVLASDCDDKRAAGVRFESDSLDEQTVPYHFNGALPDPDATQTDDQGSGGFINMPIGDFTVRSTIAGTGRFIGTNSFLSRAGTLSYVSLGPTEK